MATVHQGQHCESFKVATLNVHEWLDSNGLENTERLADVINPLHLDLLALEEVLHTDSLTMLAKLLGMPFIAFADGDLHGNAFLSRHKFLKTKSKLVSIDTHDKRSMLQVNLDHPFALENRIDFYVTHLDHAVETVRIQQLDEFKTMWTTNGNIQVVLGDFNSLTLSDYTPNYLKQITAVREQGQWELPLSTVTDYMKQKGFVDVLRATNEKLRDGDLRSCRYHTRVDYIWMRGMLKNGWVLDESKIVSSKDATDHELVLAVFNKKQSLV